MRYAIKVTDHAGKTGYLAAYKDGEKRIMCPDGTRSMISIRDSSGIKDTSYIPFWSTRQQCFEILSLMCDEFHDSYESKIETF